MYEYIQGRLQETAPEYIVVEVQGIGYKIYTPKNDAGRLSALGSHAKFFVDLVIREDAHILYGFSSISEREFFRLLIQVNGIGPKLAILALGNISGAAIAQAIQHKDTTALVSLPGIGKKLAERLIVELHEKISDLYPCEALATIPAQQFAADTCAALKTLGFSTQEAMKIIRQVQQQYPNISSIEEMVQHSLLVKRRAKV